MSTRTGVLARVASVAFVAAVLSGSALAADEFTPVGGTPFNWSGLYFGGNVGGGWGSYDYIFAAPTNVGSSLGGLIGGAQIGANWQMNGFVLGIEGDIQGSGISGTSTCPNPAFSCNASVNWFSTVRGRLGMPMNQFMPYLTGGFALGGMTRSSTNSATGDALSQSMTHAGWTIGGGLDWMTNSNWTIGGEVLYVDLGRQTYPAAAVGASTFSSVGIASQFAVARIKASYRLP